MSSTESPFASIAAWAARNLVVGGGWWGTVSLGQVHTAVGIAVGIAVLIYTVLNTVKLWRELRRPRPESRGP